MLNNKYFLIVILITMNIVFHFIPFERASLAPDDYAYLVQSRDVSMRGIFQRMLNVSDRPLNYLILMLQGKFIGDNSVLALYLLVLSSIFVLLTVYYFLLKLFNQTILAFIGSAIFCLLPNKLETYHTLIFFNINMATGIYILSLTFFIRFVQIRKTVFLLLSLMAYTIGVFWYEVGFFLPLTLIGYCLIFDKKDYLKFLYYFLIPSLCYLFIRLLGSGGMNFSQHNVGFPGLLVANELFHHLMGRYILRSIFYGIYEFLLISRPLLYLLIAVDILLLALLREFLKRISLKEAGKGFLLFGIACFVFFIAPLFLNQGGGIGGRHLVLPSLGVVILILWLFGRIGKVRDRILLIFFAVLFVVCQGNAWTQVIACRINRAVYDTLKEKRSELVKSERIIIDSKSFADNIPFTWIKRDFNTLNTYYGAQAFEDRGLINMAYLTLGSKDKSIYIAKESPKITSAAELTFNITADSGYRSVSLKSMSLPVKNTLVINFRSVFGDNFNEGIRIK